MTISVTTSHLMNTYPEQPVEFVRGSGTELFDSNGNRYLDFLSGLAVTSLGHAHPAVADAIAAQSKTLLHTSNLFATAPGQELAYLLNDLLGGDGKVFFCNSGAEANEAAIKLARKWAGDGRYVVISAERSFHGRTLATLHATGQPEKHSAFQPLPVGFRHVAWDDIDALQDEIAADVAAVLLEPIQGEGGVRPASPGYLGAVEELCRANGILFMVDEVQTGFGRTGEWFGFQHHRVNPDVVTMAKALGNGMPIGAIWAKDDVAAAFGPGDHATTFGGQPLAASAGVAVIEALKEINAPEAATRAGRLLRTGLEAIDQIIEVRGCGLLIAAELKSIPSAEAVARALRNGLIINAVTPTSIRLAPPLNVTDVEIGEAITKLRSILK